MGVMKHDSESAKPTSNLSVARLLQLGEIGLDQGYRQQAEEYFDRVLQQVPGHPRALYGKARACRDSQKALSLAESALAARPGWRDAELLHEALMQPLTLERATKVAAAAPWRDETKSRCQAILVALSAKVRTPVVHWASGLGAAALLVCLGLVLRSTVASNTFELPRSSDTSASVERLSTAHGAEEVAQQEPVVETEHVLGQAVSASVLVLALGPESDELVRGSGSVVSPDGLVLTNEHVVHGEGMGRVAFVGFCSSAKRPPDQWYVAVRVAADKDRDLAALRIVATDDGSDVAGTRFAAMRSADVGSLELGEGLIGLGYPALGGETLTLTRGSMAGYVQDDNGIELAKTDSELLPGSSGGAVLNERGEFVGVISAAHVDYRTQGRLSFFVPLEEAAPLIALAERAPTPHVDLQEAILRFSELARPVVSTRRAALFSLAGALAPNHILF